MNAGNKIFVFQCEPYVSEAEIEELINKVHASPQLQKQAFYFALPYTGLSHFSAKTSSPQISFGAVGMNSIAEGSFTQKVAISMLKEAGAAFVLIGSSFYRHLYEETNAMVNLKLKAALEEGLIPVFCVGACHEQDAEKAAGILKTQLEESLSGLLPEQVNKIVFLYEAPAFNKSNIEALVKDCSACRKMIDQVAGVNAVIINAIPKGTRNLDEVVAQVEGGGFYSGDQLLICDLLHIPFHHESPADENVVTDSQDNMDSKEVAPTPKKRKKAAAVPAAEAESGAVTAEPAPKTRAPRKKKAVAADLEKEA